jgi:hypothetical protein
LLRFVCHSFIEPIQRVIKLAARATKTALHLIISSHDWNERVLAMKKLLNFFLSFAFFSASLERESGLKTYLALKGWRQEEFSLIFHSLMFDKLTHRYWKGSLKDLQNKIKNDIFNAGRCKVLYHRFIIMEYNYYSFIEIFTRLLILLIL